MPLAILIGLERDQRDRVVIDDLHSRLAFAAKVVDSSDKRIAKTGEADELQGWLAGRDNQPAYLGSIFIVRHGILATVDLFDKRLRSE